MSAKDIVTVQAALQVVAGIVPLIQSAMASGSTTVDPVAFAAVFAASVKDRNASLDKLDTDIENAKREGR